MVKVGREESVGGEKSREKLRKVQGVRGREGKQEETM